jgi:hypothetical protein
MTTSLVFKDPNAPLTPSARAREVTDLGRSLSAGGYSSRRIQTNTNGTFKRIVNGDQIGPAVRGEINVVIVAALPDPSRVYYKDKYDPNKEATLPNCWSTDGKRPDEAVTSPRARSCAECPMNVKGSGEGNSRACRYQRRVTVLLDGDMSGEVYQMNIPAKSLFGKGDKHIHPFESYSRYLNANKSSVDRVLTNVSYDPDAEGMKLQFTPARFLTDEEIDLVEEVQSDPETTNLCRITVAQASGVAKKAAEPEDEPDDEPAASDEEPIFDEPRKRASAKRAEADPPATTSNPDKLASAMNKWAE